MVEQWVEISAEGGHASLWRGFLRLERRDEEGNKTRQEVDLDRVQCLLLSAPNSSVSRNLLAELAERGIPVIITGRNWHPVGFCLPVAAHHAAAGILHDQIALSQPVKKRLWQQLVQAKIMHQANVLEAVAGAGDTAAHLRNMARQVTSGDGENREAQAARVYWPALFGPDFIRNTDLADANALLNYGYAVLRAGTARAVCAAGLQPALGVFHSNRLNPFCLVDDLMEVYRPLCDAAVWQWLAYESSAGEVEMTPAAKRHLVQLLQLDLESLRGRTPLSLALQHLAVSYRDSVQAGHAALIIASLPELSCFRKPPG